MKPERRGRNMEESFGHVVTEAFKPVKEALQKALAELEGHDIAATVRFSPKLGILIVLLELPPEAIIWQEV